MTNTFLDSVNAMFDQAVALYDMPDGLAEKNVYVTQRCCHINGPHLLYLTFPNMDFG